MINKDSFRQLVTILLDNAVKYTPDNGSISLTLSKRGKHIQITQENTCDPSLEIDPERLFERFYREILHGHRVRNFPDMASDYPLHELFARNSTER